MKSLKVVATLTLGLLAAAAAPALAQTPHPIDPVPESRSTEPVVLTGASFPSWAAPANVTAKVPGVGGALCQGGQDEQCTHNRYEQPDVDTGNRAGDGVDPGRMLGYKWDPS